MSTLYSNFLSIVVVLLMMSVVPAKAQSADAVALTAEEKCLAEAMYHEDRSGEDPMRFVASVVLERVENSQYLKTICTVVYDQSAGCQFSFTCDDFSEDMLEVEARHLAVSLAKEIYGYWKKNMIYRRGHHFICQPRWYFADYASKKNTAWLRNDPRFTLVGKVGVHLAYCTVEELAGVVYTAESAVPNKRPARPRHRYHVEARIALLY